MKSFKTCLQEVSGLKFIYEHLQLQSPVGRKRLLHQTFITDAAVLQRELDLLEENILFLKQEKNAAAIRLINRTLQEINDISSTITRLGQKQVLDDIELFEIKKFCLLTRQITVYLKDTDFTSVPITDAEPVIRLLDPENTGIPHFYIYSSYDPELEKLRKKISSAPDPEKAEEYRWESIKREDLIRTDLAEKLFPYQKLLEYNLDQIALLDLIWSKAALALALGFCKPVMSTDKTSYVRLFNPAVQKILRESSKEFQAIDIDLYSAPCLITGANMSGKTVLLKTVALSQYLFQFGFYVPAAAAAVMMVDEVSVSIGDHHSEVNGLSSFAEEIIRVNQIIRKAKNGKKLLVLIDELARTTNPEEGKAIVSAFIRIMSEYHVMSLISTHYSGSFNSTRKLRVKGLTIDGITKNITPHTLNDYMDYSLVETNTDDVPMEALKIAEIFDVDREFLQMAKDIVGEK